MDTKLDQRPSLQPGASRETGSQQRDIPIQSKESWAKVIRDELNDSRSVVVTVGLAKSSADKAGPPRFQVPPAIVARTGGRQQ